MVEEVSLAQQRERRSNAGNKLARLLDSEEDVDEFYQTTYGGFDEAEDDNDFTSEESSSSDEVDSDFDLPEEQAEKSDEDVDKGDRAKRKKRVFIKPKICQPLDSSATETSTKTLKKEKQEAPKVKRRRAHEIGAAERAPLRGSTAQKRREFERRRSEREKRDRAKELRRMARRRQLPDVRRLTQAELLDEARLTEEQNVRSLELYQRLELQKKRSRATRSRVTGPVIRYHSLSMPFILPEESNSEGHCARTFVTFTDARLVKENFPQRRPQPQERNLCPVSGLPAKYLDPLTQTPYATVEAFKKLRELYAEQLATEGKPDGHEQRNRTVRTAS